MRLFIFITITLFTTRICFPQDAWELSNVTDRDWVVNGNLKINRYSDCIVLKNEVIIKRFITAEGMTKMLSEGYPYVALDANKLGNLFDLSFDINNRTYAPAPRGKDYFKCFLFWMIEVAYTDIAGRDKTNRNWVIRTSADTSNEYNYNSIKGDFIEPPYKGGVKSSRHVEVYSNDDKIKVTIDNETVASINDVGSVKDVKVYVSAGATLHLSNTKLKKLTIQGQAMPYIQKAMDFIAGNDPSSAAHEMTVAINKGLLCYDTYFTRGYAYYLQGYYKSAIQDLNSAINYSSKNKENAYFYRGMSKLALNDDQGIYDLRNGGQEGIVFLRENNLLDYVPGQGNKKADTRKRVTSSPQKKAALKK